MEGIDKKKTKQTTCRPTFVCVPHKLYTSWSFSYKNLLSYETLGSRYATNGVIMIAVKIIPQYLEKQDTL